VIHLASLNQVAAFAAADVDAVPIVAIKREPRDCQRLPLGACLLGPGVAAAALVFAVPHLGDHALQPNLSGMSVDPAAVHLKALAELYVGPRDDLFQVSLALDQRQLSQKSVVPFRPEPRPPRR
jgi:hypothetical protein